MIITAWYFYKFQHDFCGDFLFELTQDSEDKENDLNIYYNSVRPFDPANNFH